MLGFYQNLSLRWKVPIRTVALASISVLVTTAVLLFSMQKEIQNDFMIYAESTANTFASSLVTPLLYQETWQGFQIIRAYESQSEMNTEYSFLKPFRITVLDQQSNVFVSTQPIHFSIMTPISQLDQSITKVVKKSKETGALALAEIDARLILYVPIVHNGLELGGVVVEYDKTPITSRLHDMLFRALLIAFFALVLILIVSWRWGRRFAEPLVNLTNCMEKIGHLPLNKTYCLLPDGNDELGRLGKQFHKMTKDMAEKFRLEQQLLHGERMSALGRMASGIAHEVNNPLGGMLNAINTHRKQGVKDPVTDKTLNLLERGLKQVSNTVSALLVEAKIEHRSLSAQDIEDILILVTATAKNKYNKVNLESDLVGSVNLPANPVRQMLLNLLLNAVQASDEGSEVFCRIHLEDQKLMIRVANSGKTIEPSKLNTLFEPNFGFETHQRRGFGLWIIYQLVTQLNGKIEVVSDIMTVFNIQLPITGENDDQNLSD